MFHINAQLHLLKILQAYPVAGGQYSWVAILAPPRVARAMSYVTGWFMCTGIIAMGAVNNVGLSNSKQQHANNAN